MMVLVQTRNNNNGLVYVDLDDDDDDVYTRCNKFYVLLDWNDTNGNATISFSSFLTAAAVVFAYLWVWRVYST